MRETSNILITLTHPDARLPVVATDNSIGADVHACLVSESGRKIKQAIHPGMTRMIPTGVVAVAHPPYSIFVCSRSGLAAQRTLFVTNAPGIIDPDYIGEIKVLLHNAGNETQFIEHGDRIAQLVLVPAPIPRIVESQTDLRVTITARGDKGFGSTGR